MNYHFGLSGNMVWSLHIIIGLLFLALGFYYVSIKEKKAGASGPEDMEKLFTMGSVMSYIMIIFGILMFAYHGHLMYLQK